jgi:flagellar motor switch/type III secretory pathway protein FliN
MTSAMNPTLLSQSHILKSVSADQSALLSIVARAPQINDPLSGSSIGLASSSASRWSACELTGELQAGSLTFPFALAANPRWESLEFVTTRLLPESVLSAMISHLLDPVVKTVGYCLDAAVRISAYPASAFDLAEALFLQVSCPNDLVPVPYTFILALQGQPHIALLKRVLERSAQLASWGGRTNILVFPKLVLGQSRLFANELKDLATGDVVVLDRPRSRHTEDQYWSPILAGSQQVARGRVMESTLELKRVMEDMETADFSDKQVRSANASRDIEKLALSARAVVAMDPVRVGDLSGWAVGTLISLPYSADSDQIFIEVADQRTARGRLVSIGDKLGVEILELLVG